MSGIRTAALANQAALPCWLSPDPMGGDITNPQSLNRYAYALNNPFSRFDPLGLGYNPADQCSDPVYANSHARCGPPPSSPCEGMWTGGPWNDCITPWPPVLDTGGGSTSGGTTAGQPPLAGNSASMGPGTLSCWPFGCTGGFGFQEEVPPSVVDALLRAGLGWLLEHWPEALSYARWCNQTRACSNAITFANAGYQVAKAAGSAAANDAFGCADAPCTQRALENIQEQQENGTWESGGATTVVVARKPTVITVTPNPKSVVPAGPR